MDDDVKTLTELNLTFIDAFRKGSWELLDPILSPGFAYLDGRTGQVRDRVTYGQNLSGNAVPSISIDEVVVHVDGDVAVVSARTSAVERPSRFSRYVDVYERRDGGWKCTLACVWPLQ